MKSLYVDSSILVAILFQEENFSQYMNTIDRCENIFSSHLIEAELFATARGEDVSIEIAETLLDRVSLIIPNRRLQNEYQRIFQHSYIRGVAAFHLACALFLDPETQELSFLTSDKKQKEVADRLGFRIP
jgi:predicted nucleic acid-binding protein